MASVQPSEPPRCSGTSHKYKAEPTHLTSSTCRPKRTNSTMNTVPPSMSLLSSVPTAGTIASLPTDVLQIIVACLDLWSVAQLARTCKIFADRQLLCCQPDYVLVHAALQRNATQFRSALLCNKLLNGSMPSDGNQVLYACLWTLVVHLNEPSPAFWAPLPRLWEFGATKRNSAFAARLVTAAIARHHALGLSAFGPWMRKEHGCLLHADHALLDISRPIDALTNAPGHIKSQILLTLFQFGNTYCDPLSHQSPIDVKCKLRQLASTEDLTVIVPGLLHLGQHHDNDIQFWFRHCASSRPDETVPAIHCLLSELLRRNRRDLFHDLMRVWLFVLAGGPEDYSSEEEVEEPVAVKNMDENKETGDADDADAELVPIYHYSGSACWSDGWSEYCQVRPAEQHQVRLAGHCVGDLGRDITGQLAHHGLPDAQVQALCQLFGKIACPSNFNWMLHVDYFWSVPNVLDEWIQWFLQHTLVSLPSALLLAKVFPKMVVHLQPTTIALILDTIPMRAHVQCISSLPSWSPFPSVLAPIASPTPLPRAIVQERASALQQAMDAHLSGHAEWIAESETVYWQSQLPSMSTDALVALLRAASVCTSRSSVERLVKTMSFPRIMDALVRGMRYRDALALLQEASKLAVTGHHGGDPAFGWRLSLDACKSWALQFAWLPSGLKEFALFVKKTGLHDEGAKHKLNKLKDDE